jgi:hypothetical protein
MMSEGFGSIAARAILSDLLEIVGDWQYRRAARGIARAIDALPRSTPQSMCCRRAGRNWRRRDAVARRELTRS